MKHAIKRRIRRFRRRLAFSALLAGAWYFLNPGTGRANQARMRDQLASRIRGAGEAARRLGGRIEGSSRGVAARVSASEGGSAAAFDVDDKTVADRVRSQVLGSLSGEVHVDVADGVVALRGPVDEQRDVDALVDAARDVPGVLRVESYLHRPGTPAPNKVAALRAGGDLPAEPATDRR